MNILFASNDNGTDMLAVALYSVLKNNPANITFFIFNSEISTTNRQRIARLADPKNNIKVTFIDVDPAKVAGIALTNKTVSMEAYYRYLAAELLPGEDEVLYMDIDMMCVGSLKDLYDTELDGYYLAAVEDYFVSQTEDYPGFKTGIGFSKEDKYINSGLLLMNLAAMRESKIMEQFWNNLKNKKALIPSEFNIFADQTVTNLTFRGRIKFVDQKYNVLTTAMKYTKPKKVIIAHFAGPDKPFTYRDDYSAKYDDIYYDYYDECMAIVGTNGNRMIKNTILRLGKETTDANARANELGVLARDKSHHVIELTEQVGAIKERLVESEQSLENIKEAKSWPLVKAILGLERRIRSLFR